MSWKSRGQSYEVERAGGERTLYMSRQGGTADVNFDLKLALSCFFFLTPGARDAQPCVLVLCNYGVEPELAPTKQGPHWLNVAVVHLGYSKGHVGPGKLDISRLRSGGRNEGSMSGVKRCRG